MGKTTWYRVAILFGAAARAAGVPRHTSIKLQMLTFRIVLSKMPLYAVREHGVVAR
jgi:hypothetical protein